MIAVTGAAGQLGHELVRSVPGAVGFSHNDLNVTDFAAARDAFVALRPEVIINTAAFTHVDDCEGEPEHAFLVNALAVRNLAIICAELDAVLVQISTDYVFDGAKGAPYTESDAACPISVYGVSKLAGEHLTRAYAPKHLIVRTSGLYGETGARTTRGNFVETMLRLADAAGDLRVVADQVLAPTPVGVVAAKTVELLRLDARGVYHVTSTGQCSWYEFAREIFRLSGLAPRLVPISAASFGAKAPRPPYSVLSHARLTALGVDDLPSWQDGLAEYLRARGRLAAHTGGAHGPD
jgi:dTDP-4-dehydrorhamnose reductase